MFVETLDLYSIIIPIFMIGFSVAVVVLQYFIRLPSYFVMHALAMLTAGCALLLYSVIVPSVLPTAAPVTSTLLFMSCALFCQAVHERLGLRMNWPFVIVTIVIAEILMSYYAWIDEIYAVRLAILGFVPLLIFAHNLVPMYRIQLNHRFDQVLRFSLILLIGVVFLRISYLMFIVGPTNEILGNSFLFAAIQLVILCLSIALTLLLLCCAFQDIYLQLNQDRNQDPLTGLPNRRALNHSLEHLKRQPITMNAVLLCDIDHFKQINDQYGHHIGDLALQHASQIMSTSIRCESDRAYPDYISRIGGEEFMIILQDVSTSDAIKIAERIRQNIEQHPLRYELMNIPMTISIGMSFFHFYSEFEYAVQQADSQLYEAKHQGRNHVAWQILEYKEVP